MPVSDFECQIARGQIGRYLEGGPLSAIAMRGLEEHLAECAGCKSLVAERRTALLGKLGGEIPTHAVVSMPAASPKENPLVAALRARSDENLPEKPKAEPEARPKAAPRYAKTTEVTTKPVLGKPLALGALLAVVLVAMSYATRANGGKGVLGAKASSGFAAESLPDAVAKTAGKDKPVPKPVQPEPKSIASSAAGSVETKPDSEKPLEADAPDTRETPAVERPVPVEKAEVPVAAAKPPVAVATDAKTTAVKSPVAKATAVKPVTPKPASETKVATFKPAATKPAKAKPAASKPVVRRAKTSSAKRVVKKARRKIAARKISRKPRRTSTTVRVYGLDGRPLKP